MSVDLNYGSVDEVRQKASRRNTTTHPDSVIEKALSTARSEFTSLVHNNQYPPDDPDREMVDGIVNRLAAADILMDEDSEDMETGATMRRVAKDKIKSLQETRPASVTQSYGVVGQPSSYKGHGFDKTNEPYQSSYF